MNITVSVKCVIKNIDVLQPSGRYNAVGERIFGDRLFSSEINLREHEAAGDDDDDDDEDDDMVDISEAGKDDVLVPRCHSVEHNCVSIRLGPSPTFTGV